MRAVPVFQIFFAGIGHNINFQVQSIMPQCGREWRKKSNLSGKVQYRTAS
jgi:hypothetical protein